MREKKIKAVAYYRFAEVDNDWNEKMQFEEFCKRHKELDVQSLCIEPVELGGGIFGSNYMNQILQDCMNGKCKGIVVKNLFTLSWNVMEIFCFVMILKQLGVKLYTQDDEKTLMRIIEDKYEEIMKREKAGKESEE